MYIVFVDRRRIRRYKIENLSLAKLLRLACLHFNYTSEFKVDVHLIRERKNALRSSFPESMVHAVCIDASADRRILLAFHSESQKAVMIEKACSLKDVQFCLYRGTKFELLKIVNESELEDFSVECSYEALFRRLLKFFE